jgi:hypothetical protein
VLLAYSPSSLYSLSSLCFSPILSLPCVLHLFLLLTLFPLLHTYSLCFSPIPSLPYTPHLFPLCPLHCCQVEWRPLRYWNKNIPLFGDNSPLFQIFLKFRFFSTIFGLFIQLNT